jgi:chorismate synthase
MNTFGRLFRVSIFGESHGVGVGITIDGCPPGISLAPEELMKDISRRKSGAKGTTPRKEKDLPQIISGVFNNYSTGVPITILFQNTDTKSKDYSNLIKHPRPSHSDFVAMKKYNGFNDYRGGGYFSGRLTLPLVAAGAVAKKLIENIEISARLIEAGGDKNIDKAIEQALSGNQSIGGIVECTVSNLPVGLGEPFFGSVHALLSHIVFSIPAVKGIEFGAGFQAVKMTGRDHNDNIIAADGTTETNNAGGLNGGITNGNDLVFRVAIKPTSSISSPQNTFNFETNKMEELRIEGRHDTCIALRVPPVIEAVTAIVLADLLLQH